MGFPDRQHMKKRPRIKIGNVQIRYIQVPYQDRYFCLDTKYNDCWYEKLRIRYGSFFQLKDIGIDIFADLKSLERFNDLRWNNFLNNVELHNAYLDTVQG